MAIDHVTELLLGCFGHEGSDATLASLQNIADNTWRDLVKMSLAHSLAPLLYRRIKPFFAAGHVPPEVQQRLKEAYYLSTARNMRIYRDLVKLLHCFNTAGVPVILLKGAHLAEIIYGNIALRPMGDMDLLVKHVDLLRAHDLLLSQGYANAKKNTGNDLGHLPPYYKKNSPPVEIHYNICSPPFSGKFAVEDLWERARPAAIYGVEALTLCPEDLLLHLCVHAAIDHGFEIGPLPFFDLAQTLKHYGNEIDWNTLLPRARQWGLGRCLVLMLCLSKKMLGLSLPEQLRAESMPDSPTGRELAVAEELVFEKSTPVASDIARLFGNENLAAKLRYCLRQIFPPMQAMRVVHPQAQDRLSLLAQYFFRVKGLIKQQGRIALLLLLKDKKMRGFAQIENRRNKLKDWLVDKNQN